MKTLRAAAGAGMPIACQMASFVEDAMPPIADPPAALYVDARSVNVLLMQSVFQRLGARLMVARDGAQALQLARGLRPRLLLLDQNLPDCQAADLLQRLRGVADCDEAQAIAVTADSKFGSQPEGFAQTWTQPLQLPRTLRRLRQLLGPDELPTGHAPSARS